VVHLVDSNHGRVLGHVFGHHSISANERVVADLDVSNDLGASANNHTVADGWVTLSLHGVS